MSVVKSVPFMTSVAQRGVTKLAAAFWVLGLTSAAGPGDSDNDAGSFVTLGGNPLVGSTDVCMLGMSGTASATGSIGAVAVAEMEQLLGRQVSVTVLSRSPEQVGRLYANVSLLTGIQGSIFEAEDVARACSGAQLAIFSSPYGVDTSGDMEAKSVQRILNGLEQAGVKKLLLTCAQVLTTTSDEGPVLQDRKIKDMLLQRVQTHAIEDYAIVQTCAWMETAFDNAAGMINNHGVFLGHDFPKPVCWTRSSDIGFVTGILAAQMLKLPQQALSHHEYDVHDPSFYTSEQILATAALVKGAPIYGTGAWFYKLMVALQPVFEFFGFGRPVHLAKIFRHMLDYGYVPDLESSKANQQAVFDLGFKPSTLQEYFADILVKTGGNGTASHFHYSPASPVGNDDGNDDDDDL
ncbi:unnamed protein product [Polarella glacialis]|uniref:NAD(P)-binding domain-containing protein n=1 Tax=Polarella glacialis TaxID=89957 RepID=A0A813L1M0_POLGL|nr:unnamed protein product [Polarella glacialis]